MLIVLARGTVFRVLVSTKDQGNSGPVYNPVTA